VFYTDETLKSERARRTLVKPDRIAGEPIGVGTAKSLEKQGRLDGLGFVVDNVSNRLLT
jgi:hypothetical protein